MRISISPLQVTAGRKDPQQGSVPPSTCLASFVDEGAQGLAHGGAQVRALADGHAQGAGQPLEGPQHIRGVGAEAGQQGPDLEGKGRGGRPSPFAQVTSPAWNHGYAMTELPGTPRYLPLQRVIDLGLHALPSLGKLHGCRREGEDEQSSRGSKALLRPREGKGGPMQPPRGSQKPRTTPAGPPALPSSSPLLFRVAAKGKK